MIGRNYKAEGVVLKRTNFSEKDKLITVFTRNLGKITLIAKGIRNIQSKKAPHLELFTHVSMYIAMGKSLDIVTEAYTIEVYPHLRKNLEKVAYAYSITEIIDRLCAERQEHRNIYELLVRTLDKIDKSAEGSIKPLIDEFILETLWELGYLVRGKVFAHDELKTYLEEVMEKNLKSDSLLSKI